MKVLDPLNRLFLRFRYPVSMPEDIAKDLGFPLSNFLSFKEFIDCLLDPKARPTNLHRYMPRSEAEAVFQTALRREIFSRDSLFSYCFNEGWVEFFLQFDEEARLRRLYIQYKELKYKTEILLG